MDIHSRFSVVLRWENSLTVVKPFALTSVKKGASHRDGLIVYPETVLVPPNQAPPHLSKPTHEIDEVIGRISVVRAG